MPRTVCVIDCGADDIVYDNELGTPEEADPTTTITRGQISIQQN